MKDSNLWQLVQSLSPIEQRDALRFLDAAFFNTRADVKRLFKTLVMTPEPDKNSVWEKVHPGLPYDDVKMRLLMSYLNRLLESFLIISEVQADKEAQNIQLAGIYRRRGLTGHYERQMNAFGKMLEKQPKHNAYYYSLLTQYHREQYETAIITNPTDTTALTALANSSDLFYLINRLKLICLELSQQNVYKSLSANTVYPEILALAHKREWAGQPAITTYLSAIQLLSAPDESQHYQLFRQQLDTNQIHFSEGEMRELYMFAINHCIRKANSGDKFFEVELLSTYKTALDTGILLENGVLSRFTFHNIAGAGLRAGELSWVGQFVEEFRFKLEKKYRESSYQFNKARLEYARGHFDEVLSLLQQANYADPLLSLAAKTLLLKVYYETNEYNLLVSHIDAMRNYIHRKKVIGYHRTNYLNIVRYTEILIQTTNHNRKQVQELKHKIKQEQVLTEREWLLGKLA